MTQGWVAFMFGNLAALVVALFVVMSGFGDLESLFAAGSPARAFALRLVATASLSALVALLLWCTRDPLSRGMRNLVVAAAATVSMLSWNTLTLPFALAAFGSSLWWRLKGTA
jgi:hypothetical protein